MTKAAAVSEAVARELECMRKDAGSINQYCSDCENKSQHYSILPSRLPRNTFILLLICVMMGWDRIHVTCIIREGCRFVNRDEGDRAVGTAVGTAIRCVRKDAPVSTWREATGNKK